MGFARLKFRPLTGMIAGLLVASLCLAAPWGGQVTFGGLPLPGATVTASQGDKVVVAVSDQQGMYSFPDLAQGNWTIEIAMTGFAPVKQEVMIGSDSPAGKWELKLLSLDQIKAEIQRPAPPETTISVAAPAKNQEKPKTPAPLPPLPAEPTEADRANDGLLINGSINNGAASPFAQAQAFGNNRFGGRRLYTGGLGLTFDNSNLDAAPFSLTGQNTPKPSYNNLTGMATFGGPLKIPRLMPNGPNLFLAYQWTRNRTSSTQSAVMPTEAEREGIFPNLVIPQSRISPQALALLNLYPLPNFDGGSRYNYQIALASPTHQDALQSRFNKALNNRNQFYGGFALQSVRTDTPDVFGFVDTKDILGINTSANWSHRFGQRLIMTLGYQFSRLSTRGTSFFENREDISGNAGILGNDQNPVNWGPPKLSFSSGIAGLSDSVPSFNRNQTAAESASMLWNHGRHNVTFGGDYRRQEFNYLTQQDPRGTFTFTGGVTGNDFADFLLGIPDTSAIAFGNADKYFRSSLYDAYITDDWRMSPQLTLNAGVRWEYASPITELYNRLVNLDVAPGFADVSPVLASDPTGPLTGQRYPNSLVRPDRTGVEPRIGIAWRPISGSSLVVRAGYGVYYNTSSYQTIYAQLAQQPPLSKSLSVPNSADNPLTLANGFNASPATTANTFAIDPNFRIGYAQEWQFSIQRDLPGSLQMTASYLGIKGTRGLQEFLPNTYPIGAANPCPSCPAGFVFLTSNGNSTRESGQFQLRRRLHNGVTATLQYTFSKSIDNVASLGGQGAVQPQSVSNTAGPPTTPGAGAGAGPGAGAPGSGSGGNPGGASPSAGGGSSSSSPSIAQNWLNLGAERSLSNFDQRHLLTLQAQYTSGMGLGGGTLLSGWRGALFKEWTFLTQVTAGSGLPQTPVWLAGPVPGTGFTGTIRPNYTGAPIYSGSPGLFLNPAAYAGPAAGEWGNAGRNSITGPMQFALNASVGRTFRLNDRFNLDLRVDSTNALNHVTYTSWNTVVNNAQFGLPVAANSMRAMQTTLRVRF